MGSLMTDYSVIKLRSIGDADMYEVRLADGSTNRFIYSGCQKAVDPSTEAFDQWVVISVARAQRNSDYAKARHG
jgi:hypothetical protein